MLPSALVLLWAMSRSRTTTTRVSPKAEIGLPHPTMTPTAPMNQMVAAEVSPDTPIGPRRMAPAPRKPIPDTIWLAIRVASPPGVAASRAWLT